jgi:hypothetical protein
MGWMANGNAAVFVAQLEAEELEAAVKVDNG